MTRLDYFCKLFGWSGGTIHQVSELTGCSVGNLLCEEPCISDPLYQQGIMIGKAITLLNKPYHSKTQFWFGAAGIKNE
jgi:hypothetical protein